MMMLHHHNFLSEDRYGKFDVSFFPLPENAVVMLAMFFKICVSIYVFLSAYGLTVSLKKYSSEYSLSGKQYKEYLVSRLLKMMWGFWFAYIISAVACVFLNLKHFMDYFPNETLKGTIRGVFNILLDFSGLAHLFESPTLNGTWWYMSLAILIVLIVPFMANMSKKYGTFLVALACIFIPRAILFSGEATIGDNNMMKYLFTVLLGIVFAQYDILAKMKSFALVKNKVANKGLKFIIATVLMGALFFVRVYLSSSLSEIREAVIPVFVIYYCYEFIIDIPVIRTVLVFLGKHSMNIFLLHTFIRLHFFPEFTYSFKNWLLIDLVLLLVSLVLSIVVELVKKYSGYDKLLNKVMTKLKPVIQS